jgi:hypothetical protein
VALSSEGILDAAQLAATRGSLAATVGAIAESPWRSHGSIYHRSKDVLLAELWLQIEEAYLAVVQARSS